MTQRSLLGDRNTSTSHAYFSLGLEKPYVKTKIVNLHRCKKCKHWCKVKHIESSLTFCLKEASTCCDADMTFERYEQKPNNKV